MDGAEDPGERKILTFKVGDSEYGIALPWVWAVQEACGQPAGDEAEFRGECLPLVDLARWLGSRESRHGSSLLILGREKARVAMRIDRPGTVVQVREVRPWPECYKPFVEGVFEGIFPREGRLVLLVDPEGVCRAARGQGEPSSQGGEGE